MVHIDGMSRDILSAVATTAPIAPTTVQIFSPSSAVIVPPATSRTSTTTTTTMAEDCFDAPDWTDAYGQDCAYYAHDGGHRCALWGRSGADGSRGVAVDNCCACGGGVESSSGSVTATTAADEGGDDGAAMAGTCGKGKRGDGICANGKCCSEVRCVVKY